MSGPASSLRECPDCGLWLTVTDARPGTEWRCARCGGLLRRVRSPSFDIPLAAASTGLLFYAAAVSVPFLNVMLYGLSQTSTLATGSAILSAEGWWELGALVLITAVLLPGAKLGGLVFVLGSLRLGRPGRGLAPVFRWIETLRPWAMADVYLLGFVVAYNRLSVIAWVHLEAAAVALVGLVVATIATDAALDAEAVWQDIERRGPPSATAATNRSGALGGPLACPVCRKVSRAEPGTRCTRCGARLEPRKPDSVRRTWALIAAAAVIYVPANLFPVMAINSDYRILASLITHARTGSYTILGGVRDLVAAGYWPTALLVFIASLVVPGLKIVSLTFMLVQTQRSSAALLHARTRLWRAIDFIGRWSMIDVFMISILVGLIRFGRLSQATTDVGMPCFAGVVVLTMLATMSFDTRLMWDAAAARAPAAGRGREGRLAVAP